MDKTIDIQCSGKELSRVIVGPVEENLSALLGGGRRVILITDANIHGHHRALVDSFEHIIIGQGESSKTLHTMDTIMRKLQELGADRGTFLLGMGGGIVTDVTGFAASVYMRGISFGFVPTTLLAQVDAGIGGKNGVNLNGYKNIIGVFNHPEFVICDLSLLRTLSDREFRSGIAEIIKAGVIADPKLFRLLEGHSPEEVRGDAALLEETVIRAIKVKADIVQLDERESGERRKLNLGHTFAHAMEKILPTLTHGEAVAAGMMAVADAAVRLNKMPVADADRLRATVNKAGLPDKIPVEMKKLLGAVKFDKKRERENINMVFPTSIGSCEVVKMSMQEMEKLFLETASADPRE